MNVRDTCDTVLCLYVKPMRPVHLLWAQEINYSIDNKDLWGRDSVMTWTGAQSVGFIELKLVTFVTVSFWCSDWELGLLLLTQHSFTVWIMHWVNHTAVIWVIIKTGQYKTKKQEDTNSGTSEVNFVKFCSWIQGWNDFCNQRPKVRFTDFTKHDLGHYSRIHGLIMAKNLHKCLIE